MSAIGGEEAPVSPTGARLVGLACSPLEAPSACEKPSFLAAYRSDGASVGATPVIPPFICGDPGLDAAPFHSSGAYYGFEVTRKGRSAV